MAGRGARRAAGCPPRVAARPRAADTGQHRRAGRACHLTPVGEGRGRRSRLPSPRGTGRVAGPRGRRGGCAGRRPADADRHRALRGRAGDGAVHAAGAGPGLGRRGGSGRGRGGGRAALVSGSGRAGGPPPRIRHRRRRRRSRRACPRGSGPAEHRLAGRPDSRRRPGHTGRSPGAATARRGTAAADRRRDGDPAAGRGPAAAWRAVRSVRAYGARCRREHRLCQGRRCVGRRGRDGTAAPGRSGPRNAVCRPGSRAAQRRARREGGQKTQQDHRHRRIAAGPDPRTDRIRRAHLQRRAGSRARRIVIDVLGTDACGRQVPRGRRQRPLAAAGHRVA